MRGTTAYNLLALAACGGLAAWAYHEIQQPLPPLPERIADPAAVETEAPPAAAPAFRMPPKNAYAQLATRPPFSPTRRPPRAKPVPTPVAAAPKPASPAPAPLAQPQVTLVGIVINAETSIAMVRKPGAEELLRLAKGETLDGWLVEGVLPDRLVLSHGEKLLEFELSEAAQNGGGSARGAAAGAAGRRRP